VFTRVLLLFLVSAAGVQAALPAALTAAIERLRDQRSYTWEVINADPGPVAQQFATRRGTVTTVQQNTAPHVLGTVDSQGDILLQREWSDGVRLDTIITTTGAVATKTPEGWMSEREILTAQAEERITGGALTPRAIWLRRADRPEVLRPDQELLPLLKARVPFEVSGDTYTGTVRLDAEGGVLEPGTAQPALTVTFALNLRAGVIRDYELKLEGIRRVSRARVPVPISEHRIVIITYVPVSRIDIPSEAEAKLDTLRTPAIQRGGARR
jgi:hypothetical protein